MFDAFLGLFKGENIGKAVFKAYRAIFNFIVDDCSQ